MNSQTGRSETTSTRPSPDRVHDLVRNNEPGAIRTGEPQPLRRRHVSPRRMDLHTHTQNPRDATGRSPSTRGENPEVERKKAAPQAAPGVNLADAGRQRECTTTTSPGALESSRSLPRELKPCHPVGYVAGVGSDNRILFGAFMELLLI